LKKGNRISSKIAEQKTKRIEGNQNLGLPFGVSGWKGTLNPGPR